MLVYVHLVDNDVISMFRLVWNILELSCVMYLGHCDHVLSQSMISFLFVKLRTCSI